MTPKDKALIILKATQRHDAEKMRNACRNYTLEQMEEVLESSGETRQAILDVYEREEAEHQAAIDWVESIPTKPLDGSELVIPGIYWWLPECSRHESEKPEHWSVVSWHPLDNLRQRSGLFIGPLPAPVFKMKK